MALEKSGDLDLKDFWSNGPRIGSWGVPLNPSCRAVCTLFVGEGGEMQAQVAAAIIAGSVAAVGWFVSYAFTSVASIVSLRRTAALAHIEKQLEELYGPLAFLVFEGRQTFEELLSSLGREYIFDAEDRISPEDLKLWLFWAENDFLPRNLRIKTLLSEKTHLLYGSKMTNSYIEFLNHHNSWMIRHLRWQKEGIEYSWHSKSNWPETFEEDVLFAFSELQKEHSRLLNQRGNTSLTPRP